MLLQFHQKWMGALGLWPNGQRNIKYNLITFNLLFWQGIHFISSIINIIHCEVQLVCILENMAYTIFSIGALYMVLVYLFYEQLYKNATKTLNDLMEKFNSHQYTIEAEMFMRKMCKYATIYCWLALIQFIVTPLFDYQDCLKRDSNKKSALNCGLPTPGTFPFDITTSPGYQVAFVIEIIWSVATIAGGSQPIMLICTYTYHIIAHLHMLKDNLSSIGKKKSRRKKLQALKRCIAHQIGVIDFCDSIGVASNVILVVYAILMAFIFSIIGFHIILMITTEIEIFMLIRYILMFIGWYVILLVLSILGQKLIDESTTIADYAYNIPWYNESVEFQKMIKLMILRSNKRLSLQGASLIEISIENFNKVMSSTYSYLMLLYNLALNEEIE